METVKIIVVFGIVAILGCLVGYADGYIFAHRTRRNLYQLSNELHIQKRRHRKAPENE